MTDKDGKEWTMPNAIFDMLDEFMEPIFRDYPIGGACQPSTTFLRNAIGEFVRLLDERGKLLDPGVTRIEVGGWCPLRGRAATVECECCDWDSDYDDAVPHDCPARHGVYITAPPTGEGAET